MNEKAREKAIPKSRLGRFGRMARMAGGVAAGMLSEGAKQLSQGNRPKLGDMLLTPKNAKRVVDQLATMRGAAMKVGQLLSMETSDFLPPELADILAQLRNRAFTMPREQLLECLQEAYGDDWQSRFSNIELTPMAAASIGQVHRASSLEGDDQVLKIQYPGVSESIDSDVDNIASLLRVTNLLPKQVEIDDLLADAKTQLHEEADYHREAEHLLAFGKLLEGDSRFVVPDYYPKLSTHKVLAMSYVSGQAIEKLDYLPAEHVDQIASDLFALMLRELFELRTMQTDANFANYLYDASTQKIGLLDFGATRSFTKSFVINYKRLIRAVTNNDEAAIVEAADLLGYGALEASEAYQQFLVDVFQIALEPFATPGFYDFKAARISERLAETSERGYNFKEFWRAPPSDILFLHRKIGGMFLLCARLGARVKVSELTAPYIKKLALD